MPQLGSMAIIIVFNSQIEFRRHGLVAPSTDVSLSFFPWSHICYCKWLSTSGMLFIQTKNANMQIKIALNQIEKMNAVLVDHVDTRDSSGQTINADRLPFEYPDEPPPLERRRLQFNLKTALLFMVVASSAFAWLGIHLRAGWREQEALAKLEEFGVEVGYKDGRVDRLNFSKGSGSLSDDDLRHLAPFERLRWLNLSETPITDAGLEHIKNLSSLKYLMLFNTQITDDGLEHVGKLTRLKNLGLAGTQVTNAGLVHLKLLSRLERLGLEETQVTGAGLEHIEGLTNLVCLSLFKISVGDEGLVHIGKLTRLEVLNLSGTQVTDTGLAHIERLTGLTSLHLTNTQVTDAGLIHLKPLTRLELLTLKGTEVTDAGLVHLEGLPDLEHILYDDPKARAVKASLPITPPIPAVKPPPAIPETPAL